MIAGSYGPALMQNALRCGIAALVLVALLPPLRAHLPRGRLAVWAAVSGLLMVTIYFEGFAEGVIRAGAGNASVLASTSPLFVLVLGRLFLGERMPWAGALGLVCGFAGIVLMVWSQLGGGHGSNLALGMALALTAGASWAVGTLLVKWLTERARPRRHGPDRRAVPIVSPATCRTTPSAPSRGGSVPLRDRDASLSVGAPRMKRHATSCDRPSNSSATAV